jgi:hypothetical protein
MYKRILLPVDGSACSKLALEQGHLPRRSAQTLCYFM